MKIPFFRQFTPGIQLIMLFSLTFLGFIIAQSLMYIIGRFAFGITDTDDLKNFEGESILNIWRITFIAIYLVSFITPALFFARHMEYESQDFLFIRKGIQLKTVLVIIGVFILCFPAINFLHYINIEISFLLNGKPFASEESKALNQNILFTSSIQNLVVNLIGIALLTAIGEELIFRPIVMRIFSKFVRSIHNVVWITAIIFSTMHVDIDDFIPRVFMGAVLGYILIMTGNVWYCILLHFLNNGVAVLFGYLYSTHKATAEMDFFGGYGYTLLIGGACIILIGTVGFLLWKKSEYIDTFSEMIRH